jgi:hypothetical protein
LIELDEQKGEDEVITAEQITDDTSESDHKVAKNEMIVVPELTFSKSDAPTQFLASKMQKWMRQLLGKLLHLNFISWGIESFNLVAIFGHDAKRETGPNSWNSIVRNQRVRNCPLDSGGKPMQIRNFQQMQPVELGKWRDHIIDSFTEESKCEAPLQFLFSTGEIPVLTVYRMGKTDDATIRKGKGKSRAQKVSVKIDDAKKKKSKNVIEESHDEEPNIPVVLRPKPKPRGLIEQTNQSHTLQAPNMLNGTLPSGWRKSGYQAEKVSTLNVFHSIHLLW